MGEVTTNQVEQPQGETLTLAKIFEGALRVYYGGPVHVSDHVPELHPKTGRPHFMLLDDVLGQYGGKQMLVCHTKSAEKLLTMLRARHPEPRDG